MSNASPPIDPSSPLPLYAQVEKLVRELIADPKYENGELLPDEVTLARKWGVSRNTMRTAMSTLVTEGVLERRSGVGTSVRKDRLSSGVAAWRSFNDEMKRRGVVVQQLSTRCEEVPASPEVARALQIPVRTRVIYVERVRGWNHVPSVNFESYLHPRVKLTTKDDYARPLSALFAERAGVIPARSLDEFSAIAAVKDMAGKLNVRVGSPLLLRKRVVYDTHDKAIEFALVTYRSDRFSPTLTLE
jgi:GntR family transcriptional regulator